MVADRITVGVYALDQLLVQAGTATKGWAARLSEAVPALRDAAMPLSLQVAIGPQDCELAKTVDLGGVRHHAGAKLAIDPVDARPGLFLVRIGGKACAVASALPWEAGRAHPDGGAEAPEALAGYVAGTLIDTPEGPRPVETLVAGDAVTTLGNGSRPLRWVGRRRVELVELLAHPGLRPVVFSPDTLGNRQELRVSPQQRVLIDDWRAAVYFGEDRVLVGAQALVDDEAARVMLPQDGVDYVLLLCDRHEVLLADGALSESYHPGETGLAALPATEVARLLEVVAEPDLVRRRAAYPVVRNAEARALRLRV